MNSISEAILKQRPDLMNSLLQAQEEISQSSKEPKPFLYSETSAIQAVLAGGYNVPQPRPTVAVIKKSGPKIKPIHWAGVALLATALGLGAGYRAKSNSQAATHEEMKNQNAAPAHEVQQQAPAKKSSDQNVARQLSKNIPAQSAATQPASGTAATQPATAGASVPATAGSETDKMLTSLDQPTIEKIVGLLQAKAATEAQTATLRPVEKTNLIGVAEDMGAAEAEIISQTGVKQVAASARQGQVPDDAPIGSAIEVASVNASSPGAQSAAEVLYEAEPVTQVNQNIARSSVSSRPASVLSKSARPRRSSVAVSDAEPSGSGGLRVEGIFWDKQRPMALIGGNIVEPGAHVGSAEIVEINANSVVVSENGVRRTLHP